MIVTLGALSIFNFEMSLSVLAALLTIVGYSINDTIVIFDRIRESRGRGLRKGQTLASLVNTSLNQTLSRTILTSFTTFMASVVLFLFGGEVLRDFAFALVVGVVLGTYSTVGRRVAHRGLGDVEPEPPELAAQGARQGIAKKTATTRRSVALSMVNLRRRTVDPAPDPDRRDPEVPAGRRSRPTDPRLPLL